MVIRRFRAVTFLAAFFTLSFAGFGFIHQFAKHGAGCVCEQERHHAMNKCNDGDYDQGRGKTDGKAQMLEIAFVGIVQMLCQKGILFHSFIITHEEGQKKSQIFDAGQHGRLGQVGGLLVERGLLDLRALNGSR